MVGLEFLEQDYEVWIVDAGLRRVALMAALRKALPDLSIPAAREILARPIPIILGVYCGAFRVAALGANLEEVGARLQIISAPEVYNLEQFLNATIRKLDYVSGVVHNPCGGKGWVIRHPGFDRDPVFDPINRDYVFLTIQGRCAPMPTEWLCGILGVPYTESLRRQEDLSSQANIGWLQELAAGRRGEQHAAHARLHLQVWERYVSGAFSLQEAKEAVAALPDYPMEPFY